MTIPANLVDLIGHWRGTNRLWLSPADPVHESGSTMLVAPAAQGRFITFQYTWDYEGDQQDGLLLLGVKPHPVAVKAVWIDSWHMQDNYMLCEETNGEQGEIFLTGSMQCLPGRIGAGRLKLSPGCLTSFNCLCITFHLRAHRTWQCKPDSSAKNNR